MAQRNSDSERPRGKHLTAIVKPTHDCNLRCSYCYMGETERGIMSEETLKNVIVKMTEHVGKEGSIEFLWHGGEPLIAGLDFYKRIVEIQKSIPPGYHIKNSIQSNGTLLTEEIADFFASNGFTIGLSLDGPPSIHNQNRAYQNGRGSFEDVMRAIRIAKEKKIGGGVVTVMCGESIDKIDEIYEFLRDNRIDTKMNPLTFGGRAATHPGKSDTERYGLAMAHIFDRWLSEPEYTITVSPFEEIIAGTITGIPMGCNFRSVCQDNFISISPAGHAYPCGRFEGKPEFFLGDLNHDTMDAIDRAPVRELFRKRTPESINECGRCEYKAICNSGCPDDAYTFNGDINTKTGYCKSYRTLFKHIKKRLETELL